MKVALYCRVSTEEQKHGISIKAQKDRLRKYAEQNHYSIVDLYSDDGVSGGKIDRPELNRLLKDVKLGKIDMILFIKLDRWFRSVAHYYKIQEVLDEYNVIWKATDEDYETETSSGKFKVNVMLSVSQQFKDATSERVRFTNDYKINVLKEVISGKKICGYDIVDKKYVINKEEAEIIKDLFNHYLETNSIFETTIWFNNKYYRIDRSNIRKRLTNRFYIGEYEYKGEIFLDMIPAILDKETFNKVQETIKKNIKKTRFDAPSRHYYFAGLVKCGVCGKNMYSTFNKHYKYYRCKTSDYKLCSNKYNINENQIESLILQQIQELAKNKKYKLNIKQKPKTDNTKKIKSKIENLQTLFIDGLIDKESYTIRYNDLTTQLKEQEEKQVNVEKLDYIISGTWKELYDKLDDKHRQLFFRDIIKQITIYDRDNILIELLD